MSPKYPNTAIVHDTHVSSILALYGINQPIRPPESLKSFKAEPALRLAVSDSLNSSYLHKFTHIQALTLRDSCNMPSSVRNLDTIDSSSTYTTKVSGASTIEELVAITPKLYQVIFGKLFRKYSDLAVKLSHARTTLSNFETHKARGTFPPVILGCFKEPVVQVSKEFAESADHQTFTSGFASAIKLNREQSLQACIDLKKSECANLEALIAPSKINELSSAGYQEVWNNLHSGFASGLDAKGNPTYATFFVSEYNVMKSYHKDLCLKALSLGFSKHQRELSMKMAKLAVKKDTDTEMHDASSMDIKKYIDQAIRKGFKVTKDVKKKPNSSTSATVIYDLETNFEHRQTQSAANGEIQETQRASVQKGRKRKREWEQEAETELQLMEDQILGKRFRPKDALSYPESFASASQSARMAFSLLHSSLEFVESLPSYKAEVFRGPGVSLPKDIQHSLALNGKFILHSQKDILLVHEAFLAFQRTIRIKWFFRNNYNKRYFNPKFYVKTPWEPPNSAPHIESAITAARSALFRQVVFTARDGRKLNPETSTLRTFLTEKRFLVKITDKNLGLAVLSWDWYHDQCEKHLRNQHNYLAHGHDIYILQERLNKIMDKEQLTGPIKKYLLESDTKVPKFHVIPKVHKTPWASRPIVPSHSWITSRASKVVDYFLQKALVKIYWVLQSTRDFVKKLTTAYQVPGNLKGYTLATGDVREMYTNIPVDEAIEVCNHTLKQVDLEGNSVDGITALLRFVLKNNFFEYEGTTFWQFEGIAMGTPCAPTVANLYLAFHESKILEASIKRGVLFYGRYIDDIFLIFKGNVDQTQAFVDTLTHPHLSISWELSAESLPFLDVHVRIEKGRMETSVYTKRLNRYMYVPFSSAHPLSVKRALVKGERSRFKAICSNSEDLRRVEQYFRLNLYRRGYPSRLLRRWCFLRRLTSDQKRVMISSFYLQHTIRFGNTSTCVKSRWPSRVLYRALSALTAY